MSDLEAALLAAHKNDDVPGLALLYAEAASVVTGEQAAFYLTHAYVFALEAGMAEAEVYYTKLKSWGREE